MKTAERLRLWARRVKRDGVTLWFATRHPATPWAVKLLGLFVVAYALSPIDLIPDFIPVFGYLDDFLLLPGLIWLGVHLLPYEVLAECREHADAWLLAGKEKPLSYVGAIVIVLIWLVLAWLGWAWMSRPTELSHVVGRLTHATDADADDCGSIMLRNPRRTGRTDHVGRCGDPDSKVAPAPPMTPAAASARTRQAAVIEREVRKDPLEVLMRHELNIGVPT